MSEFPCPYCRRQDEHASTCITKLADALCVHEMPPSWCAICTKKDSPEEEQAKEDASILNNLGSWNE